MIKAPIDLQDLRRRIYVKAKAEPSWRDSVKMFGW
jgi:RNA-directed DNA polymerase